MATVDGLHGRGRRPTRRPRARRRSCSCTRGSARSGCGATSRRPCTRPPAGACSPSRASGTAARTRRRSPRTPAFFHEEALDVLPALLAQLDAPEPLLVGHSDGGSIALIHAAHHAVSGLALMAPHVVVEDVSVEAIRETRREFEQGELRARMARHHDDPDAAFRGWCDVWLDPAFRDWSLEADARARHGARRCSSRAPTTRTARLDQLDRIEARVRGPVAAARGPRRPQPAPRAARGRRGGDRGVRGAPALAAALAALRGALQHHRGKGVSGGRGAARRPRVVCALVHKASVFRNSLGDAKGVGYIDGDYGRLESPPPLAVRARCCETRAKCAGTPRREPPARSERQARRPPLTPSPSMML